LPFDFGVSAVTVGQGLKRKNYSRGYLRNDGIQMVIKGGCPLHPKIDGPVDPDSE